MDRMRVEPMTVRMSPLEFKVLGLEDPAKLSIARSAYFLGYGGETLKLLLKGGIYAREAASVVKLAADLGMNDEDQIVVRK